MSDLDDEAGLEKKIVVEAAGMVFNRVFAKLTEDQWATLRATVVEVCVARIRATPHETLQRIYSDYCLEGIISGGITRHPDVQSAFTDVVAKLAPALADRIRNLADKAGASIMQRLDEAFRY